MLGRAARYTISSILNILPIVVVFLACYFLVVALMWYISVAFNGSGWSGTLPQPLQARAGMALGLSSRLVLQLVNGAAVGDEGYGCSSTLPQPQHARAGPVPGLTSRLVPQLGSGAAMCGAAVVTSVCSCACVLMRACVRLYPLVALPPTTDALVPL